MTLTAYHNDHKVKADLLSSLKAHAKADRIVKGQYWEDGKGCAVGCTLDSVGHASHCDHMAYERKLGIPVMLARLEDTIFEGLSNGDAKEWPIMFAQAIKPGADLSRVGWKFQHWILTGSRLLNDGGREDVAKAIKQCADVLVPLTRGRPVDKFAAWSVARSARSAADSAEFAARSARSAADFAEFATYEHMAEKLLRLMRAAK